MNERNPQDCLELRATKSISVGHLDLNWTFRCLACGSPEDQAVIIRDQILLPLQSVSHAACSCFLCISSVQLNCVLADPDDLLQGYGEPTLLPLTPASVPAAAAGGTIPSPSPFDP